MSHLKDCTHYQQCASVLAGLSANYVHVNCHLLPLPETMLASCTEREHVIVSAITHPFVSRCTHILKTHLKSDLLPQ